MNYDPNLGLCGRLSKQVVRLTFSVWMYRKTVDVTVHSNCMGLDVIRFALEGAYSDLGYDDNDDEIKSIELFDEKSGKYVDYVDDEDLGEDGFLQKILIAAEIISIEHIKKKAEQ
jgi:hypothetical protein